MTVVSVSIAGVQDSFDAMSPSRVEQNKIRSTMSDGYVLDYTAATANLCSSSFTPKSARWMPCSSHRHANHTPSPPGRCLSRVQDRLHFTPQALWLVLLPPCGRWGWWRSANFDPNLLRHKIDMDPTFIYRTPPTHHPNPPII